MPLWVQFVIPPDKTLTLVNPCFLSSPADLDEVVPVLQIRIMQSSSEALKSAIFSCADYKDIEPFYGEISPKNLIFLDPPYIPNSKTASFTDYSIDGFDSNKHKQLGMQLSKLLRTDTANVIFTTNYNDKSIELFVEKN